MHVYPDVLSEEGNVSTTEAVENLNTMFKDLRR